MYVSTAEYNEMRRVRPYNPSVWDSLQHGAVEGGGQGSPVMSPHAALRFTVPAALDRQVRDSE